MKEPQSCNELEDILRDAPSALGQEYVVCRGKIHQSQGKDELLLQTDPSSWDKFVYIAKDDIMERPVQVLENDLGSHERGHDIFEFKVRKGAIARHYRVRIYKIGFEGTSPPQEVMPPPDEPGSVSSIESILIDAPDVMGEEYLVVRGTIIKSPWPETFIFQPDPSSRLNWALIGTDQLVGSDSVEEIPESGLAPHEHGHRVFRIRIRHGEEIKVFRGRTIAVGVPYLSEDGVTHGGGESPESGESSPGCHCKKGEPAEGGETNPPTKEESGGGGCGCAQKIGKCGGNLKGSGWPCKNPGTFCRCYGINPGSGVCTTVSHWWWGCVCDCV